MLGNKSERPHRILSLSRLFPNFITVISGLETQILGESIPSELSHFSLLYRILLHICKTNLRIE